MQAVQQTARTSRTRIAVLAATLAIAAVSAGSAAAMTPPLYPANMLPKYQVPARTQAACTYRTLQRVATVSAVAANRDGSLHGGVVSKTGGTTSLVSCATTRQKVAQHVHGPYPNEATMIRNPVLLTH